VVESLKHLILSGLLFLPASLFAERLSALPQGIFGPKRTLVWYMNFDENNGAKTVSVTGRSTGTLTDGAAWVTGLHGSGVHFSGGAERVLVWPSAPMEFITAGSTFTLGVVYRSIRQPIGPFISRMQSFGNLGWAFGTTTDAVGDFFFYARRKNTSSGGTLDKMVSGVVPRQKSGGNRWHLALFDHSSKSSMTITAADSGMFLDCDELFPLSGTITLQYNRDEIVISSMTSVGVHIGGTGGGFTGDIDILVQDVAFAFLKDHSQVT